MKTIIKLHLNSLRVCNTSKVYALTCTASIFQVTDSAVSAICSAAMQFLNYVIYRVIDSTRTEAVHDYSRCDDEMFLYSFASAMLLWHDDKKEEAFLRFEDAERYLVNAEGNEFFCIFDIQEKQD